MSERVARQLAGKIAVPRVYLAGKMKPKHDWRGPWSTLSREKRAGVFYGDLADSPATAWLDHAFVVGPEPYGVMFELTGPFPASCDHGCAHSVTSAHMAITCGADVTTDTIRQACLETILHSDLICAHINTHDAYGTIAEVAWAVAHKIPVSLTFERDLISETTRVSPRVGPEGNNYVGSHDLWFIEQMVGGAAVVRDAEAARQHHAEFIKANWLRALNHRADEIFGG